MNDSEFSLEVLFGPSSFDVNWTCSNGCIVLLLAIGVGGKTGITVLLFNRLKGFRMEEINALFLFFFFDFFASFVISGSVGVVTNAVSV